MYELKMGTSRLVNALYSVREDKNAILRIARELHYMPEQLAEDIQALYDYYLQADNPEKEAKQ